MSTGFCVENFKLFSLWAALTWLGLLHFTYTGASQQQNGEEEGEAAGSEPLVVPLQERLCAQASVQFFVQAEEMCTHISGHSCRPQERRGDGQSSLPWLCKTIPLVFLPHGGGLLWSLFLLQAGKLSGSHLQAYKNRKITPLSHSIPKWVFNTWKSCLNPRAHLNYTNKLHLEC